MASATADNNDPRCEVFVGLHGRHPTAKALGGLQAVATWRERDGNAFIHPKRRLLTAGSLQPSGARDGNA